VFSLRYKFSLVMLVLLSLTVGSILLLLKYSLKPHLLEHLQHGLRHAAKWQAQQQQARLLSLQQTVQALQGSPVLHQLLTQLSTPTPQQPAPLDSFTQQYPHLPKLLLYDAQSQLRAASSAAQPLLDSLAQQPPLFSVQPPKQLSTAWLHMPQRSLYLLSAPLFAKQQYLGYLVVLEEENRHTLETLKANTGFEVLLFNQNKIQIDSGWLAEKTAAGWRTELHQQLSVAFATNSESPGDGSVQLGAEPWFYAFSQVQAGSPYYVFLSPTKPHLSLIAHLEFKLLLMSGALLLLGLLIAQPLFRHIRRSVHGLQAATEQIEKENYQYRTEIYSNDEFASLGRAFNRVMHTLGERQQLHTMMETLVSKELAEAMLKQNLHAAGEERHATVLFSGIRDFSHLVSSTEGPELLALLNNYFTRMDFCVSAHNGFIDKYFGDNLLALFGLNNPEQSSALLAIRAARKMQEALLLFNLEIGKMRGHTWKIGIGINTGRLVAGNVGAENRRHYSVIGNPIRQASNLEKLCKKYGTALLISQSTFESLQKDSAARDLLLACRELDWVQLGRHTEQLKIYQVLSRSQYEVVQKTDFLERFQTARGYLQEHNFRLALQALQNLHEDWTEDVPTRLLLNRCRRYVQDSNSYALENPQGAYVLTASA